MHFFNAIFIYSFACNTQKNVLFQLKLFCLKLVKRAHKPGTSCVFNAVATADVQVDPKNKKQSRDHFLNKQIYV